MASAFKPSDCFHTGFPDYIPIQNGSRGEILAQSCAVNGRGGEAVLVAGTLGKGKVLLCGLALGCTGVEEEITTKGDEKILLNAIYWLTEK